MLENNFDIMSLQFALGFSALILLVYGGTIQPILHSYVSLSTSNPQLSTLCNFSFVLPAGLPPDGTIHIEFPP